MKYLRGLLFFLLICFCAAERPDDCPVKECPKECRKPSNCTGGLAYDYRFCECCPVCAKVEGEICGGRFQEKGTCDKGLICSTNSAGVKTCQKRKCPRAPTNLLCPLLPNTCNENADCDEGTNCCFDGCRRRCRDPYETSGGSQFGKPKPGKCPVLPRPELCAADVDECHFDWDCVGDKKCCSNECYKQCVSPFASGALAGSKCAPPKQRGPCPIGLRGSCVDDEICQANNPKAHCCFDGCRHDCLDQDGKGSALNATKSGECPVLRFYEPCVSDNDQCIFDLHCFGDKKCCFNDCFKVCVDPRSSSSGPGIGSIILPSQCPNITKTGSCHIGLPHTCVEDGDCASGTFCCSDGCRRRCMDPNSNTAGAGIGKGGKCPADLPAPEYCPSDVDECFTDYDCIQDKKCCSNGCYKMCVSPSLSVGAAYKCPLVTESYKCHNGFKHLCEDDKECKVGGHYCCFDGCRRRCQHPIGGPAEGISVFCLEDRMIIDVEKSKLNGMKVISFHLNDPQCTSTSNSTHYSLEAPLIGCGTKSRHTEKFVVYSNEVMQTAQLSEGLITRNPDLNIPFACFYGKEGVTSTYGLRPRHKTTVSMDGGDTKTQFTLDLSLFHDLEFTTPYGSQAYPLTVTIDKPLYVQASADINDKWLRVTADSCYATPSPNQDDPKKYYLIRDGCAADPTVRRFLQAPATKFRFSFDAFEFVGESHSFIYLHCHMVVCNVSNPDSRCALGCLQLPRKRRAAEEAGAQLSQGPLVLINEESHPAKQVAQGALSSNIMWAVVAMAVFCVLCLVAIVYMKFKKNGPQPDAERETTL